MYSLLRGKMKAILWYEVNYIKLNWVQILKESFFFFATNAKHYKY